MASVTLTDTRPLPPPADFAFEIDFQKGVGPASRVFAATHEFIRTCEALDAALVQSIDSSIEAVLVLEDIEAGSIKTWLRSLLTAVDDEALRTLDWRQQVGPYLVKAKYAVLKWADDESGDRNLPALREEIRQIAAETDVRHLPDYSPPSPRALIDAVRGFQGVKERLVEGDRAIYISEAADVPAYELKLTVRIPLESIEDLAVARKLEAPATEMILPVKKPDYLGDSKWQLRHGQRNVEAKIEDTNWLRRFQNREEDVRPGDALRCIMKIEYLYGHDNELLTERYTVLRVLEVLVNRYVAPELDFGGGDDEAS